MSTPDPNLIAEFHAQGFRRIDAIRDADEREALRRIYDQVFATMVDARRRCVPGSHREPEELHACTPGADDLAALEQPHWEANGIPAHHSHLMPGAGANRNHRDRNASITMWHCPPQTLEQPLVLTWGEANHG